MQAWFWLLAPVNKKIRQIPTLLIFGILTDLFLFIFNIDCRLLIHLFLLFIRLQRLQCLI